MPCFLAVLWYSNNTVVFRFYNVQEPGYYHQIPSMYHVSWYHYAVKNKEMVAVKFKITIIVNFKNLKFTSCILSCIYVYQLLCGV